MRAISLNTSYEENATETTDTVESGGVFISLALSDPFRLMETVPADPESKIPYDNLHASTAVFYLILESNHLSQLEINQPDTHIGHYEHTRVQL